MYTRGYRPTPSTEAPLTDVAATPEKTEIPEPVPTQSEPTVKERKRKYKARRNMPEFREKECKNSTDDRTREPPNGVLPPHPERGGLFTGDELFVLALAVLLLLEGSDDILILALGYILCP